MYPLNFLEKYFVHVLKLLLFRKSLKCVARTVTFAVIEKSITNFLVWNIFESLSLHAVLHEYFSNCLYTSCLNYFKNKNKPHLDVSVVVFADAESHDSMSHDPQKFTSAIVHPFRVKFQLDRLEGRSRSGDTSLASY